MPFQLKLKVPSVVEVELASDRDTMEAREWSGLCVLAGIVGIVALVYLLKRRRQQRP
jgi:hypothetical protein